MKYLFGGSHGFYFHHEGQVERIFEGPHYGITWNKNVIFTCRRNIDNDTATIVILDKSLNIIEEIYKEELRAGVHQILWDEQRQKLVVVATENNAVVLYDVNSWEAKWYDWHKIAYQYNIENNFRPHKNHINSVFKDGKHYWIAEQNGGRPSCCKKTDLKEVVHNVCVGMLVHNVCRIDNHLYLCNSEGNSIIKYSLEENKIDKETVLTEEQRKHSCRFTRGLAITPNHFIAGLSHMGSRPQRKEERENTKTVILDNEMNIIEEHYIKGGNQIWEVRAVGEKDYAHNGIILEVL